MSEAIARSWNRLDGALAAALRHPLARRLSRNSRLTIPGLHPADLRQLRRCRPAADAARPQPCSDAPRRAMAWSAPPAWPPVTAMSLDRFASIGAGFADNPAAVAALPGLRNIGVFGPDGESRAVLHPHSAMAPRPARHGAQRVRLRPAGGTGLLARRAAHCGAVRQTGPGAGTTARPCRAAAGQRTGAVAAGRYRRSGLDAHQRTRLAADRRGSPPAKPCAAPTGSRRCRSICS